MSEADEKGFVMKDKRKLDETGKSKTPGSEEAAEKSASHKKSSRNSSDQVPLPEVNFPSLIFSLSSTALFHLGELPDPQTNEKKKDLQLAKHAIDTIAMLKDKTAGNLSTEEEKFVVNVLTDLRLRYVKEKN